MLTTDLIQSGMVLIPIPHGLKRPIKKNWNLKSNCVHNTSQVGSLVGQNIGLAHAYCTPAPTSALDIDNYHQAKTWLAGRGIFLKDLLLEDDSVVIHSGKKYSLKILFRLPIGHKPLESVKIQGADGKSALEFRCATKDGKTVQDVLPPSFHPGGHQYKWVGNGDPLHLPTIPEELLILWKNLIFQEGNSRAQRKSSFGFTHKPLESPRQIATVIEALNHIDADCSYEVWRNIVWSLLSTDWKCAEDLALKWSQSAPNRFDVDTFWNLAKSYKPNMENAISIGTIYHHARLGGWDVK